MEDRIALSRKFEAGVFTATELVPINTSQPTSCEWKECREDDDLR